MTDPKQRKSIPKKMLSLKNLSTSSPPRGRSSEPDLTEHHKKRPNKKPSKLSPTRVVAKGVKALVNHNHDKRRSVRPIQQSVASSITYSEFTEEDDDTNNKTPPVPCTKLNRAISLDSDSKPLRPYRRESSASRVQPLYSDPVPFDLSCSVTSSITFADFQDISGLLGDEFLSSPPPQQQPPPPNFKRAISMDSDSKPLRPLRRESHHPGTTNNKNAIFPDQCDYPEPRMSRKSTASKRSESMDSLPVFPSRRESASAQSRVSQSSISTNKSLDYSPCVPGRKGSMVSLGYEVPGVNKRISNGDDQPCSMPSRKISMAHVSVSSTHISEELTLEKEEEGDDEPPDSRKW